MKPKKADLRAQRSLIEKKLIPWLPLRGDHVPSSGWMRAIRDALGISSRELASRLGLEHSSILEFEKKEAEGKVSFETITKVAKAMHCRFVYAILPGEPFDSLDGIAEKKPLLSAHDSGVYGVAKGHSKQKKTSKDG
jgi:predicted DNA-binding mobile mystery protein A